MGKVRLIYRESMEPEGMEMEGDITRVSNQIDMRRLKENRKIEEQILIDARRHAVVHGLIMKFLDIEYKFDRKKLVFFFTADGRVDFRELVKTLASEYRTRIELRQIGARDEAKRIGGIGLCGRETCCTSFLRSFSPINVSMARDQNLLIKPEKFSGLCGKLMCCLKYEHNFYLSEREGLPEPGSILKTENGDFSITIYDVFNKSITVQSTKGEFITYSKEDFVEFVKNLPEGAIIAPSDKEIDGYELDDPIDEQDNSQVSDDNSRSGNNRNHRNDADNRRPNRNYNNHYNNKNRNNDSNHNNQSDYDGRKKHYSDGKAPRERNFEKPITGNKNEDNKGN
ncbi:MAG: hypothetical protein JXR48_02245 [Candidatus Delongbacteria bacterium]|nr:hypothetical protein [Candidatus Delongbacteria bacterium]MBN2833767.1 hypothetical protein [Candidatus Delongbacteria bacterium]